MLQRLFFEEMAKGSSDPNAAAAAALLRLSDAPKQQEDSSSVSKPGAQICMAPPAELEVPAEAPEPTQEQVPVVEAHRPVVPFRPPEKMGMRRPRAASQAVAVRS